MYLSHDGLKNLYEVSCDELDYLVDKTRIHKVVLGARMMGGGFGGCTIKLIHSEFIDVFISGILDDYSQKFSLDLSPVITSFGEELRYKV